MGLDDTAAGAARWPESSSRAALSARVDDDPGLSIDIVEVRPGVMIRPRGAGDDEPRLRVPPAPAPPAGRRGAKPWSGLAVRAGIRPLLIAADLIGCLAGALATSGIRPVMVLFTALVLAAAGSAGLYRSRLVPSLLDDLPQMTGRLLVVVALTMTGQLGLNQLRWDTSLVDWQLPLAALITFAVTAALRAAAYQLVRHGRRTGRIEHRTLILGADRVGRYLARTLATHPQYGLRPIGFLDVEPAGPDLEAPLLGRPEQLVEVLLDHQVRNVIVAFGGLPEAETVEVIRTCDRMHCEIFVVPRLFELHHVDGDMDTVWGLPLTRLRRAAHRSAAWRLKRAVDVAAAGLGLVLLSPLLALISLGVRLETGPGVLFRQERVGVDGRPFFLLKFRSLKPVDDAESATRWNVSHDHRLGPLGRLLRRSSLDELPQLINILRGDMSLVGPRPERPHFVAAFRSQHPHYLARHRVPCGLTGLAQVHGLRGDTSIAERARFDNYYIENWSLWLDVKILLRTAMSVLRAEGS
jgi:exopolysaccharide biosynthesis polyprenyl glycosylphosphotransferase